MRYENEEKRCQRRGDFRTGRSLSTAWHGGPRSVRASKDCMVSLSDGTCSWFCLQLVLRAYQPCPCALGNGEIGHPEVDQLSLIPRCPGAVGAESWPEGTLNTTVRPGLVGKGAFPSSLGCLKGIGVGLKGSIRKRGVLTRFACRLRNFKSGVDNSPARALCR